MDCTVQYAYVNTEIAIIELFICWC